MTSATPASATILRTLGGLGLALGLGLTGCSGDDTGESGETATGEATSSEATTEATTGGESTDPGETSTGDDTTTTGDGTTTTGDDTDTTGDDTDTDTTTTGGTEEPNFAVMVRGALFTADIADAKAYHDPLASGGEEAAKMLGDFSHDALLGTTLLGTQENKFLGLDRWDNVEGMQAFYSDPDFGAAFGMLFDGEGPLVESFVEMPQWHTWGDMNSGDAFGDYWFVVARGTLADEPEVIMPVHDMVAAGGEETVKAAGDVAHVVFLGLEDPKEFLAIDIWKDSAAIEAVYSDPDFAAAFGMLFAPGTSTVEIYGSSDWHQW